MKRLLVIPLAVAAALGGGATRGIQDTCGPFADVPPSLCPFVFELYALGITAGTSSTTFSADSAITRGQAAVFVAKGLNQSLVRSSRRAALGHWWTTVPRYDIGLGTTPVGSDPFFAACDGTDVWVANNGDSTVSRVRASDGRVVEAWTAENGIQPLAALGRLFLIAEAAPFQTGLYMIDPSQPPGAATQVGVTAPGAGDPFGLAFDGSRVLVAVGVSLWAFTPSSSVPWPAENIPIPGGASDVLYDGTNTWVIGGLSGGSALRRIDSGGAVLQTVPLTGTPQSLAFDGTSIWIPTAGPDAIIVIRAATGSIIATLTGNGLISPKRAAFDGERFLVTASDSVFLWRAADLAPLGSFTTGNGSSPVGVCSDGLNFWIVLRGTGELARF